ncbi:MAG: hypothetical protein ACOC85_04055 [Thermoplasmatota archaeon]
MKKDKKGIAGFFLDIPALLVIIIALSLFTYSIYITHTNYLEEKREQNLKKELEVMTYEFRNYDYIAESDGIFKVANLQSLNISILIESFNPDVLGYHYSIEIIDNSGYNPEYSFKFQTQDIPPNRDIYSQWSSVVVRTDGERTHLCNLRISIWEA